MLKNRFQRQLRPSFSVSFFFAASMVGFPSAVLAEDPPVVPQPKIEQPKPVVRKLDPKSSEENKVNAGFTPEGAKQLDIERESRIIRHEARGGVPLERSKEARTFEGQAPELPQFYDMSLDGKLTFPSMPACRKGEVERREVFHYSLYSDLIDLIVFDASNQADFARAANGISVAVPWVADTPMASDDPRYTPWLRLAASFDLKCLPARLHLVTEDANRFIEVRRGSEAWVETAQDKIDKKRFAADAEKLKSSGK